MKERPILFSAPMVRAILAGQKNQTRRRILKNTGLYAIEPHYGAETAARERAALATQCPYGQPGDRLWVREAFRFLDSFDGDSPNTVGEMCLNAGYPEPWAPTQYEADGARDNWMNVGSSPGSVTPGKLRPGIHMPRWASRILLEVTAVRVERLKDISDADLELEGIQEWIDRGIDHDGYPRDAFRSLWESINGAGSWDANPWVWAIEFKKVGAEQ